MTTKDNKDVNKMNKFIDFYKGSDRIADAYNQLVYYYKSNKDS